MEVQYLIGLFGLFLGLGALVNYLMLRWTRTLGLKNQVKEGELRWSSSYKPAIGGISFFIIFLIAVLTYTSLVTPELSTEDRNIQMALSSVVIIGFLIGLADDAFNTVPWMKFLVQVLCGVILATFGMRIDFFEIVVLDFAITIFWTVAVMNSINMLDNMDGITAIVSIGILTCAAICAFPFSDNNLFFTFICGGTVAALLGFLMFNWNPSKIYMGDTGSQMLGALLAGIGVLFFWNNETIAEHHEWYSKVAVVMTAFVIPIADTLTVTINRLAAGKSPFVGGRDHTTHHLSYMGYSDRGVAYIMMVISTLSIALVATLKFAKDLNLPIFFSVMALYAVMIIGFLYGTTLKRGTKSTFEATKVQSALE